MPARMIARLQMKMATLHYNIIYIYIYIVAWRVDFIGLVFLNLFKIIELYPVRWAQCNFIIHNFLVFHAINMYYTQIILHVLLLLLFFFFLALIDVYRAVRERRREAMHREYMQLSCLLLSCMHMWQCTCTFVYMCFMWKGVRVPILHTKH